MSEPVPPALIAQYDQAYAEAARGLDGVLQGHRENVARVTEAGLPEATAMYALVTFLLDEVGEEATVSMLAVAVNRIHHALQAAQS